VKKGRTTSACERSGHETEAAAPHAWANADATERTRRHDQKRQQRRDIPQAPSVSPLVVNQYMRRFALG